MPITLRGAALLDGVVVPDVLVEIDGDQITAITAVAAITAVPTVDAVDDAGGDGRAAREATDVGGTMLPAYVDLHCHGGGGASFTSLDPDGARAAARHHHERGSTSLVASLVTASPADLERGVAILAELADEGLVDGIHLEGPWLAAARCGAHDPALLRDPDPAEVERLLELGRGHVRMVTLAPERTGALDLVRRLVGAGVHAAIGHTAATYAEVAAAVDAGADLATHLFNGMDPWHHRTPGAVPALLRAAAQGEVVVELVADGVHLADETVATVFELLGADRVAFVSDATAAAGMGDGRHVLGGMPVVVVDGVARLERGPHGESPGPIAGGTSHVADIVARALRAGLPLAYAVESASATPARVLGLDDRGVLGPGARADLVVVDELGRVGRVMRAGHWLGA
jgi:N-acetylglucosamine-6-phosphate deacetylase